jgi:hypothetical protein
MKTGRDAAEVDPLIVGTSAPAFFGGAVLDVAGDVRQHVSAMNSQPVTYYHEYKLGACSVHKSY